MAPAQQVQMTVRKLMPGWPTSLAKFWFVAPALVAFAIHLPSLRHGFVGDDAFLVLGNPQVTSPSSLREVLLTDWFDHGGRGGIGYYRPVVKASFRLTYAVFGANPLPYHATNVLAHGFAAMCLCLLAAQLIRPVQAFFAAALFAVHPATVEAVDVITARSDVFAGLFVLASLAALIRWRDSGRLRWLWASVVLSGLAYGSKESALLLPVALFAWAYRSGQLTRRLWSYLPFAAVWLGMLAIRLAVSFTRPIPNALAEKTWLIRAEAVFKVIATYLRPLALAQPLFILPRVPKSLAEPPVLVGICIVAAAMVYLWSTRAKTPGGFAIILIGVALAPALVLWHIHIPSWKDELPAAERWLYLPLAGIALLAGYLLNQSKQRAIRTIGFALLPVYAGAAWIRTPIYASNQTYMAFALDELKDSDDASLSPPDRYVSRLYRAVQLKDEGHSAEALPLLVDATKIAPWLADAWKQLGAVHFNLGHAAEAERALKLVLSPEFANNLEGLRQRAEYHNDTLERMDRLPLYELLARALIQQGKTVEAAKVLARASQLRASRGRLAPTSSSPQAAAR